MVLVRLHLDYAVQFWSPYYRMDIILIERICNFSYERRLKLLKLHSLERHRVRGDLIEVFKWVKGFDKRDIGKVGVGSREVLE